MSGTARDFPEMPKVGLEPTRGFPHRILSPARLPVPPLRRTATVAAARAYNDLGRPTTPRSSGEHRGGICVDAHRGRHSNPNYERHGGRRLLVRRLRRHDAVAARETERGAAACRPFLASASAAAWAQLHAGRGLRFPSYKGAVKRLLPFALLVLAISACGSTSPRRQASGHAARPSCPAAWRAGWQALANRIEAPVYCPTWIPRPLDAQIGGPSTDIDSVSRDGSYLISFVWFEAGGGEVHVNLRGYPGRTRLPICSDLDTNKPVPCFSDPRGNVRVRDIAARVYTANEGVDLWHVLYAWRHQGSLYAISEHVAPPYTYAQVVGNLKRMLGGLVLVEPT
jgi:hypothetical protein